MQREAPGRCACGHDQVVRDPDTLDTWFSSALWPYSTLGWPDDTEDLRYFYPTDVLVTGYDIIFFWVIRMVFSSLYSLNQIPFSDVYLTGIIRDAQGRKMSKSLNNGIDPLEIISEYGADALRFMLVTGNSPGNDMRFHMEKVEHARNFANKLWNASRFVLMYTEDGKDYPADFSQLKTEDRWILSLLRETREDLDRNFDKYEIGLAASRAYDFTWDQFCDWYIELVKPRLYQAGEDKDRALGILLYVLEKILKMLHPFIPFITEEIYAHLPGREGQLMDAKYSDPKEIPYDADAIEAMHLITESITGIRNLRQEKNISPHRKSDLLILTESNKVRRDLEDNRHHLIKLGFGSSMEFVKDGDTRLQTSLPLIFSDYKIYLPMADLLDLGKEKERLETEQKKLLEEVKRLEGKLSNENFVQKAPETVVAGEREKLENYRKQLEETRASLQDLEDLAD